MYSHSKFICYMYPSPQRIVIMDLNRWSPLLLAVFVIGDRQSKKWSPWRVGNYLTNSSYAHEQDFAKIEDRTLMLLFILHFHSDAVLF